jgi:hypothetical protein
MSVSEKVIVRKMDDENDSDSVTQIQNRLDKMMLDLIEVVKCAKGGDAKAARRATKRMCESSFRVDDLADSMKTSKDGTIEELERKNKSVLKKLEESCKNAEKLHALSQKKLKQRANQMLPTSSSSSSSSSNE